VEITTLRTFVKKQADIVTRQFFLGDDGERKCACLDKAEIVALYEQRRAENLVYEETKTNFRKKDAIDPVDIDAPHTVSCFIFDLMLASQAYFMFSALVIICCNVGLSAVILCFQQSGSLLFVRRRALA
jgi:hypothetical protein